MRKLTVVGVVAVMIVAIVALSAGCGDSQAKKDVQQGDKYMENVEKLGDEMGTTMSQAFTNLSSEADFNKAVEETKAATAALSEAMDKAKTEYEKAASASGDYGEYAKLQIDAIEVGEDMVELINSFLDDTAKLMSSGNVSTEQITQLQTTFTTEATKLNEDMEKAQEEAAELGKKLGL